MLDYKSIIIKRYAMGLSYKELAEEFSASKSGNTTSSALLKGAKSCRIRFRKESQTMRSTNWYTVTSQVPTDEMSAMNSLTSPQSLDR